MVLKFPHRMLQRGLLTFGRFSRGMTLGVRAMLLKQQEIVLVRHSYVPGWYLPGGGVEAGESFAEALAREIEEEAGARLTGAAQLFGLYRNGRVDRRDHVALFVCRDWESVATRKVPNLEIAALGSFRVDALPEGTTEATRSRIREVLGGEPVSVDW